MIRRFVSLPIVVALVLTFATGASALIIDDFDENLAGGSSMETWGLKKGGELYQSWPSGNLGGATVMGDTRHSYGWIDDYVSDDPGFGAVMGTRATNHIGELRGVFEFQDLHKNNPGSFWPLSSGAFATVWWDAAENSGDNWGGEWPFAGYSTIWGASQTVGSVSSKILDWNHEDPSSNDDGIFWDLTSGPGSTFSGFEIDAWQQWTGTVTMGIEVWDWTGKFGYASTTWTSSPNYETYQIPFSAFSGWTTSDWQNIGAVRLLLDIGEEGDGTDFQGRIDEVRTIGMEAIPEPGTVALFGLGGAMLLGRLRRRRKS